MLFNMLEEEFLAQVREMVDIPHAEKRARLLRELELTDPKRRAREGGRLVSWTWVPAARMWLGDGLVAAGDWLAGHRSSVL